MLGEVIKKATLCFAVDVEFFALTLQPVEYVSTPFSRAFVKAF